MSEMNTADLANRLRCRYPVGPIMKNGEPEFGWRDFGGDITTTLPTPLMIEAASAVEKIAKQRDELLAALKYHQEQTRPIQQTIEVIAECEAQS